MHISRFLLPGLLALVLADSASAQNTYNSYAERMARESEKRDRERERYKEQKAEQKERQKEVEKREANERAARAAEVKPKAPQDPRTIPRKVSQSEQASYERTGRINQKVSDALRDNDVDALGSVIEGSDFNELGLGSFFQEVFKKAYVEMLVVSVRDSVKYFRNLRRVLPDYKNEQDRPRGFTSRNINGEDFVALRLMVLTGNYNGAIERLRTSSYYGANEFTWSKNDEAIYRNGEDSAREAYHFTNYMAGRCFQVLNMPDSAAYYLERGRDFSGEWSRLAAFQKSENWAPSQPMVPWSEAPKKPTTIPKRK